MCTIELNRQRINKKDDIYQNSWLDILVTKMCSRRKLNQFILIKKLFNFLTLFTFHLLTYCKKFPCNAYHINSWFCGNFLKEVHSALFLLDSFHFLCFFYVCITFSCIVQKHIGQCGPANYENLGNGLSFLHILSNPWTFDTSSL